MNHSDLKIVKYLKSIPWYKGSFDFFECGNFPSECPWQKYQELDTGDFIKKTLQPIATLIPITYEKILASCQNIYSILEDNKWFLIYAINEDTFLCGGEPTNAPSLKANAISDGWEIPVELRTLYSVHNGFGTVLPLGIFLSSSCVLPDYKLDTLSSLFKDETDFEFLVDPKSLLEFYPDGLGNAQCFHQINGELTTVDWDHESREIYHQEKFWDFIDKRLSELI